MPISDKVTDNGESILPGKVWAYVIALMLLTCMCIAVTGCIWVSYLLDAQVMR